MTFHDRTDPLFIADEEHTGLSHELLPFLIELGGEGALSAYGLLAYVASNGPRAEFEITDLAQQDSTQGEAADGIALLMRAGLVERRTDEDGLTRYAIPERFFTRLSRREKDV